MRELIVHLKQFLKKPKENQRIFEGTQPAIIEYGQWERVQALRVNKHRPTKIGKTSIFSGLVYCAEFDAKLYYCTCISYKNSALGKPTELRFQKLSVQYEA